MVNKPEPLGKDMRGLLDNPGPVITFKVTDSRNGRIETKPVTNVQATNNAVTEQDKGNS